MDQDKLNQPLDAEEIQPPEKPFFDPYGGLDPILVELADVLPAKVFKNAPLN